ncbi:MAG TPA: 2-oxoglutarate and iron-dependent oxygenase domain-containing protein [Novosphingobium sp.]|nr:2-oxoglutarate and iron-dependent oxygenase domain-containing protein [Novosphingobium sp.]
MTELAGLWQRLLIALPGQPVDTLTRVDWLQGPVFYIDLRQPEGLVGRISASCLAELVPEEARLLARQEGFAGRLALSGDLAEWQREIDFRPCPLGDHGRLERHGDLMIEHGIASEYIEYWQREACVAGSASGSGRFVAEADGRAVLIVRHGQRFAYARARTRALAAGELERRLATADPAECRELVDCEISMGTVTPAGWRIDRSSLPWRVGDTLVAAGAQIAGARLDVADTAVDGLPFRRGLRLIELHGSLLPEDEGSAAVATAAKAPPPSRSERQPGAPFEAVPVIDISALGGGDPQAEAACVDAIRRAAEEVGFLMVTGHGMAPELAGRLQHAARRFFELPLAAKQACYIGKSTNHRGYVPEGEEQLGDPGKAPDRKEAFDLALDLPTDAVPAGHPMLGPNQWPDLPGFREDVMAWYGAVFAVGRRLLRAFALALGQPEDAFDHLVTMPPSQLRLIHYPHDPAAADAPGIGAHTDYELFTLLLATGPGLEVMNQAGAWIDAPPVPDALVVNIGDMLEYWSAGRFVATSHRVRKVGAERWSFPLFFALDYDVELRPLGKPEAEPIRTGEHLLAQTVQTFRYLKDRELPDAARPLSSFGQVARHRIPDAA